MNTHTSGGRQRERRAKGRNKKPEVYFSIEIILLAFLVYVISFANIKFLTILSALAAIFFVIQSCYPRYRKVVARQTNHKVFNYKEYH